MLPPFPLNRFESFHNVSSLSSLHPHSFISSFPSGLTNNENKGISFNKTIAFTPPKPFYHSSPNKIPSPSLSFEFNEDSFSDLLSLASTSASSSFDSLSSPSPPKYQNLNTGSDVSGKKQKKRKCVLKVGYKKKFKTEICKFWSETGICKYGEECAFAHGSEEIKEKIHTASNYKSRKCVSFHENGYCVYGARCHFIHSFKEDAKKYPNILALENIEAECHQDADCVCNKSISRMRLPCFSKMAVCCL